MVGVMEGVGGGAFQRAARSWLGEVTTICGRCWNSSTGPVTQSALPCQAPSGGGLNWRRLFPQITAVKTWFGYGASFKKVGWPRTFA